MDILDFLGGGNKFNIIVNKYEDNFLAAINEPIRQIMSRDLIVLSNKDSIENDKSYENEMIFMAKNALKNEQCGLPVSKVVDLIKKIDSLKNPKPSYVVGLDAKLGEMASHLPLCLINKLMDYGLKLKGLR